MSVTYFRNMNCFCKEIKPYTTNNYKESIYLITNETAESNVFDKNNNLCWHTEIFHVGTYMSMMRKICTYSYHFESGSIQWKPRNKTPENFITTTRKLMENAIKADYADDYYSIICEEKQEFFPIIEKLANLKDVKEDDLYSYKRIKTNNIELMYWIKLFMNVCKDNYYGITPVERAKEYAKQTPFCFNCPEIIDLFK